MVKNNRGDALLEANQIINGQRQDVYGDPEDSFSVIAKYWNTYLLQKHYILTNNLIESEDVAIMMALLKIARIGNGTGTRDSSVDCCGYIALAEDILSQKRNQE